MATFDDSFLDEVESSNDDEMTTMIHRLRDESMKPYDFVKYYIE